MRIGSLRHRVTIQSPKESRDDFGGARAEWFDVATVWAKVEPLGGTEVAELKKTGALYAEATHKVTVRYRSDVTEKMRIVKGDRVFDIASIVNTDERNRELVMMCGEPK